MDTGENKRDYQLKPLTKTSKTTGEIYYRREEVNAQIIDALSLSENELLAKISQLKSETLVFLFREKYSSNYVVSGKIWELLFEKIYQLARRWKVEFVNIVDFEYFVSQIQDLLMEGIYNLESNEFDYAQVSFGEFVKGIISNKLKKKFIVGKTDKNLQWLDDDSENEEKFPVQLIAKMTNSEKQIIFREALNKLPRDVFEVCYLHYLEGIQIDSKDQSKITLTKIFQKSDKTIRTWLGKAEEILKDYRGELR